jgi:hypothetical protein
LYAIPDRTRTSAGDSALIAADVRANIYRKKFASLESNDRWP